MEMLKVEMLEWTETCLHTFGAVVLLSSLFFWSTVTKQVVGPQEVEEIHVFVQQKPQQVLISSGKLALV